MTQKRFCNDKSCAALKIQVSVFSKKQGFSGRH